MLDQILSFADVVVVRITPILNDIVAALLIVFIGFIIGKILGNIVARFFRDVKTVFLKRYSLANTTSNIVKYTMYTTSIIFALQSLNALWLVLVFIVLCFAIVLGFSLFFTIKDFLPNFLARSKVTKKYEVGKSYSIRKVRGVVENIGLLEVRLRKKNDDIIIIPHKEVVKQA